MRALFAVCGVAAIAAACTSPASVTATFVSQVDWADRGEWIRADTHVHTRFSDGALDPEDVVARGVEHGCQALAITDHGDRRLEAATPKYAVAIELARVEHPGTIVIAGMEWNVPPFAGEEHATVLMPDGPIEVAALAEFKKRFDHLDRDDVPVAAEALTWLASMTAVEKTSPVVIYNHPSRKDGTSLENVNDIRAWREVNDLVIGFEGAPGHQGREPIGAYEGGELTVDRWDPVVATPDGAWDQLLRQGLPVHAAIATSDFHDAGPGGARDYWPCQFAETQIYVPEKTVTGVLRALRAGSSVGVHGRIAHNVSLSVTTGDLPRPAVAGEVIHVPAGTVVEVALDLIVPETDWQGQPNRVDRAELFVITGAGTQVREHPLGGPGAHKVTERLTVGPDGLVVRARGRRVVADGPDLMFYTNAIRITATN